jgi:hypothetical protein
VPVPELKHESDAENDADGEQRLRNSCDYLEFVHDETSIE